jgi:polyferredoxin
MNSSLVHTHESGSESAVEEAQPGQVCKELIRRISRDHSQAWRRLVQSLFLVLNVGICFQFVLFVHYFESGERSIQVSRPPGVEGWLPIAGLMNFKYFLATGNIPSIHPAAMVLFIAFLMISILFRKAFCSWLCPVGTLSEALWKLGRKRFKQNWRFPRWIDMPLRSLKYLLLAFFLYAITGMSAGSIEAFLSSPYGLITDVKMLHFFLHLSQTAAITLAALLVLSIFFQNFWRRYLCPYGALLGLAAIFSQAKIRRDVNRCIDCSGCTRACPALLKVDELVYVRSAECTGCLECVAACPAEGALQMSISKNHSISPWLMAAGLAIIFVGIIGYAKWKGAWSSDIPNSVYEQLIPKLNELTHP